MKNANEDDLFRYETNKQVFRKEKKHCYKQFQENYYGVTIIRLVAFVASTIFGRLKFRTVHFDCI